MFNVLAVGAALAAAASVSSGPKGEEEAVRSAVLDYVESVYDVQPERLERSVDRELNKFGHIYQSDGSGRWASMSYSQLVELAGRYNLQGRVPADAPKEIKILDLQPRIANAKLKASWGVDYLLLTKGSDGRWKIRQVLWEGNPPAKRN